MKIDENGPKIVKDAIKIMFFLSKKWDVFVTTCRDFCIALI